MLSLESLDTEKRNINTMNLDELSTVEIIAKINQEDKKIADCVEPAIAEIGKATDFAVGSIKSGGRLIYMGAGTSGRLGILDASECPPTYGVPFDMVIGIIAGGDKAIRKAVEGAEDSKELAVKDLKKIGFNEKDTLVGLAASGRTPYVIGGLEYARSIGAKTAAISCVQGAKISDMADAKIEVIVGAEAVTGSTRMKAGTAQKMVLNMISTTAMVKIGKVYQNLMVDVATTNEKLKVRALNIVSEATGIEKESSKKLLEDSGYDVKVAIVMGLASVDASKARKTLEKNDLNVSATIKNLLMLNK
ncbi:N-acetylmuramic acid 6-phosphate etherase [Lachnospiraceae oral taxon 107 str. F0167]|uniref:N-acetylmuramic acid 6-phosphate etherase n=1 Tax=Lachnoanaerobaculum sp. Marseille-Q4761 TaxID=2819511 RepID=UPI0002083725|nr:N-acetylmuramic acid 6-phosphate etherase [uncultured Lachnoanaerobaculum sp.]EGG89542.1 N-acetylmuramic acid 6-phosphate etherase [Lachnospiraceae oral taxon 107 str. F0167]MBO1871726.1 N-acetylmuramic acid 6-phosphate etherase [Lachnoanaerobaculum sp. Marseille-Q4761]RKW58808.1 MAG: N-acetylmuramic acid 6-phosphate etherase [Lachnospiraceae bacterium]